MIQRLLCAIGVHDDKVTVIDRLNPTRADVAAGRLVLEGRIEAQHTACRSCGRRCR